MSWCWLALVADRPPDALAAGEVSELAEGARLTGRGSVSGGGVSAGYLVAWAPSAAAPRPGALRVWRGIVDPAGAAAVVSLVLAPPGRRVAFDDPAVQQARRAVLAGRPAAAVSTLLSGDSLCHGAISAWRGVPLAVVRDDPFARIFPARVLRLGPGLIGSPAPPGGPTIERYGSSSPWPADRFDG